MNTFFLVSGAVLVVNAILQLVLRQARAGERPLDRLVNRTTVRAFVFILAGILGILLGAGVLPLPRPPGG